MSYFDIINYPDFVLLQTDKEWIRPTDNTTSSWSFNDVNISAKLLPKELNIAVHATCTPIKRIVLRWKCFIEPGTKILGDHWERGYGDLEWRGIVPERVMPWYFLTSKDSITNGYGVKTSPKAMCFWQTDGNSITLCLDVRCGSKGVILNGKLLDAATIVTRQGIEGESPFIAAKNFCSLMCDKPLVPQAPIYGGNNWYYAYGNSSHNQILEDSKFIAELSPSHINRPFMIIDDGWQLCHSQSFNGGPWKHGNYLFPDMQKLAMEMKLLGTKPGIWMRPLLSSEKLNAAWLLSKDKFSDKFYGDIMDPSVPEVLNKIDEDIKHIISWGYDLIKHDFSTFDIFGRWGLQMNSELTSNHWSFKDTSKTSAEVISELYRSIRKAAGKTSIIGCNTVSHLSAGIFEIQRTGDDTSGREWERTRKMGINTLAFRMPQHETFYACDADCVGLTKDIPWDLNKQWLKLLSMSGTPLFVSADQKAVDQEQKKVLKKAFEFAAQVNTVAEPLDWLDTICPEKWLIGNEMVSFNWSDMSKI